MSRKRQARKARQRARQVEEAEPTTVPDPGIAPAMKEVEIRREGLAVDVPYEAAVAPQGKPVVKYTDGSNLADEHRRMFPDAYREDAAETEE